MDFKTVRKTENMVEKQIGFLEEEAGVRSATRLIFVVGSFWLMAITSYLTIAKIATITEAGLFFASQFVLIAGSKLVQKSQESQPDLAKNPNATPNP